MKPSRRFSFSSSSTSTVTFTFHNNQTIPVQKKEIPIQSLSSSATPITAVHLPQSNAATRIQSAYRAHLIRTLYRKISSVNREADKLERLIQMQETVDSIRSDDREKLRMNESLMGLLLRLDSVPGIDPSVREARRKVSRRIVGLQEILDAICEAKAYYGDDHGDHYAWGPNEFWMRNYWEEAAEEELCRERGGEEMEKFCAQYLGLRCFQRFLRE